MNRVESSTTMEDEPRFIVFHSMLLQLFSLFCFSCKSDSPTVNMWKNGTTVTVSQNCTHCGRSYKWRSQPFTLGKHPAGNILLSFSTLVARASISKTILIFKHLGLSMYSIRTFFLHQRKFLFPSIMRHWQIYQSKLMDIARRSQNLTWSGDGRYDSMGHFAKFWYIQCFLPV